MSLDIDKLDDLYRAAKPGRAARFARAAWISAIHNAWPAIRDLLKAKQAGWDYALELLGQAVNERDHWKANHDEAIARQRILIDRPDLPLERTRAAEQMKEVQAENARLRAQLEQIKVWHRDRYESAARALGVTPMEPKESARE